MWGAQAPAAAQNTSPFHLLCFLSGGDFQKINPSFQSHGCYTLSDSTAQLCFGLAVFGLNQKQRWALDHTSWPALDQGGPCSGSAAGGMSAGPLAREAQFGPPPLSPNSSHLFQSCSKQGCYKESTHPWVTKS